MNDTAPSTGAKAAVSVKREDRAESHDPVIFRAQESVTIVIFGASGDLSKRKLIPALYHLQNAGYLPDRYAIVGFSRTPMSDEAYRDSMRKALQKQGVDEAKEVEAGHPFLDDLYYQPGNVDDRDSFVRLKARLETLEQERKLPGNRLFYLSVAPEHFTPIIDNLCAAGLICDRRNPVWSRVVVEKPFGIDLASARKLNAGITAILDESQLYRIDHYLGKETVQNILTFRFGNSIFEPLFNQKYVDHVQITAAETQGMEGRRGAYYDSAGALRDMAQNHMLQLLCLIAMEPPAALEAQAIRDEKVKVLRALAPLTREEVAEVTVRGQYGVGERDGAIVKGYRQEHGVAPTSMTETYIAVRATIDNWRWAGVPFYLRTGKRLHTRVSEIAVAFKQPPLLLFQEPADHDEFEPPRPKSNVLALRIQPNEGISLSFACKRPGMNIRLEDVHMDFFYEQAFPQRSPEAYERLLLDALRGDASLFTRSDEVEYAWRFISSIHEGWAHMPPPVFPNYYPFTDGPDEAHRLMEGRQVRWQSLSDL
jgi:glucose-6-phosphate 1-dehydrogenase